MHGRRLTRSHALSFALAATQAAEKGFWHNNVTGESTWKQPDALGIPSPDGGRPYWLIDGAPTWTPPSEYAWRAVPSTEEAHAGRVYFENWRTKETTWDRPAALGWSRRSYNNSACPPVEACAHAQPLTCASVPRVQRTTGMW